MVCAFFNECGGCSIQHISYDEQLNLKKSRFSDLIRHDVDVFNGSPFNYRNRMDFIFHSNGVGLRKKGDWKTIIDIDYCPIADDKINKLLKEVRQHFVHPDFFDVRKHSGTFKYVVIRCAKESSISFVLNEDARLKQATDLIKEFAGVTSADNVIISHVPAKTDHSISSDYFVVKGSDLLSESLMGRDFKFNVQGFFQNNTFMANKMQEYVHKALLKHKTKESYLLDLYAGVATFGIINANLFRSTIIVEEFAPAIEIAKKNIKQNEVSAEAHVLDAKNLKKLDLPSPLFVITDPPRSGMHPNTTKYLNLIKPELIIYISCNPKQLAKDLHKLSNYKIDRAALFDLFPQTNHMEAIVVLKKV